MAEKAHVLAVLNSDEFVDVPPLQVYSRYIVGAHVHNTELGIPAKELMQQIFKTHGVPLVVHSDRDTSMTSTTVAALLADLEVTHSLSRPRISNDNPFSESIFKTLQYVARFPERFESRCDARKFMDEFTHNYNHHHRHTGLGLHTPADVHYGLAAAKAADRRAALDKARAAHPHRFATTTAPKILNLPEIAYINRPTGSPGADKEATADGRTITQAGCETAPAVRPSPQPASAWPTVAAPCPPDGPRPWGPPEQMVPNQPGQRSSVVVAAAPDSMSRPAHHLK